MPNSVYYDDANISSKHWAIAHLPNNKVMYVLTGTFNVNLKGQNQNWLFDQLSLSISLPETNQQQGLSIEYWAPFFTLNSVYNQDEAVNSGHAVNDFWIDSPVGDPQFGTQYVSFKVNTAVRDSDAYIYKIGFNITLIGTYRPEKPTPPIP